MTKKQVLRGFKEAWCEIVASNPRLRTDKPARCEAWNNYTDSLCKDRLITPKQYSTWTNPF